jgi:hypothetical protein
VRLLLLNNERRHLLRDGSAAPQPMARWDMSAPPLCELFRVCVQDGSASEIATLLTMIRPPPHDASATAPQPERQPGVGASKTAT